MRKTLLTLLILTAGGAMSQAAELFPLQPGSRWEYRADGMAEPLVMQVGFNQLYVDGRVYSRLTGYVEQPVWARLGEGGDLYYLDEEAGQERILTMFGVDDRLWFEAPLRPCDQEGHAHSDGVPYGGPTGRLGATTAVRYRSFSCADAGVETEQFAANIGMVSRTVTTFAGPVEYKLVYADTGAVQAAPRKGATLRLALERDPDKPVLKATLRPDQRRGDGPEAGVPDEPGIRHAAAGLERRRGVDLVGRPGVHAGRAGTRGGEPGLRG